MVQTYLVLSFLYGVLVLGLTVVGIFADFDQSLTVGHSFCSVGKLCMAFGWFRGSSKVNLK